MSPTQPQQHSHTLHRQPPSSTRHAAPQPLTPLLSACLCMCLCMACLPPQALTLLVKYVYVIEPPRQDAPAAPAQASSAWLPQSPVATLPLPSGRLSAPLSSSHPLLSSPAFSPPVQGVGRKLYRLLRRTFAQWQPSSSASLNKVRPGHQELWGGACCPMPLSESALHDVSRLLIPVCPFR